jgi:hypothetical protein
MPGVGGEAMIRFPLDGSEESINGLAAVLSASIRLEHARTPEAVRAVARALAAEGATPGRPVVRLVLRRLAALGAHPGAGTREAGGTP